MKRLLPVLLLTVLVTLCSCQKETLTEPMPIPTETVPIPTETVPIPTETVPIPTTPSPTQPVQSAPDSIPPTPNDENGMYGITFLGYDGVEAITPPYAFISMEKMKIMESVMHEGDEYFLIVPTSETAIIEVYDLNPNDPIGGIGALLHQSSPGVPLILRCNLSDIQQNTSVRIQDGENYATFSPYIDLMTGMVYVEEGGYELDISKLEDSPQYTVDYYLEDIVNIVGEDFILGRTFLRQADEVIFDQTCAVYALGTDTPEKFTAEEFLAISSDGIVYWYDVLRDSWLGWSVQE